MIKGFKEFVLRGNVIDLAVGVVIGAAFTAVVNALVKGLITPFIGAIVKVPDFSKLYFTINDSQFLYGEFINSLVSFLLIAAVIYFFVVVPVNALLAKTKKTDQTVPTTKKCPECLSEIPLAATRCAHCTSTLI
ncbi:MAG: large conductance mechanosensitive channel protein MscL [Candidatus Taylorbacteria bacterium]|nr:large conductance mechanosensitive channel protein MscL [Candidatus Taylorbacteria bacterium]